MQTSYAPLSTQIISDGLDVSVISAYGGAGQLVDLSSDTDSVRIWNQDTNFGVEYQIDSGAWVLLRPGTQVSLDIDLSANAVRLRLAEFAPSGRMVRIDYSGSSLGIYAQDAEGIQNRLPATIVIGTAAPDDDDGEPDDTVYIQVTE